MKQTKKNILNSYPELELTVCGDFKIKDDYVSQYEIFDFHCHLFQGLEEMYPPLLKKEKHSLDVSLFDRSCFPFTYNLFNLDMVYYTGFPDRLLSRDGLLTRMKLKTGVFALNYATPERLLHDMKLNHITKALVLQINPPNKNSSIKMQKIVDQQPELMTFGSVHPYDVDPISKIEDYLSKDIKGWKLDPHVWGVPIDCDESINLLKKLDLTGLPILSCSGCGATEEVMKKAIFSKKSKRNLTTQRIQKFYKVMESISNSTFIFAHGGLFEVDLLIELMLKYPNTYTDISVQTPQNIRKLINALGSERLLFGTDYPFVNHAFSILSVLRATANEEDRENIFSRNAHKILDINT